MPFTPLDRVVRGLGHDKGSKIKSVTSPPTRSEGSDGDMQIYNGHLYIKDRHIWHHFVSKSAFRINKFIDNTGGTISTTISNTTGIDIAASTGTQVPTLAEFENAIASLTAKINKIIELLQLDIST